MLISWYYIFGYKRPEKAEVFLLALVKDNQHNANRTSSYGCLYPVGCPLF